MAMVNNAFAIDQIGFRSTKYAQIQPETTILVHNTEHVRIVQFFQPALRGGHVVLVVDAVDGHALALHQLHEKGMLHPASGAPSGPDVELTVFMLAKYSGRDAFVRVEDGARLEDRQRRGL